MKQITKKLKFYKKNIAIEKYYDYYNHTTKQNSWQFFKVIRK